MHTMNDRRACRGMRCLGTRGAVGGGRVPDDKEETEDATSTGGIVAESVEGMSVRNRQSVA